MALIRQINKNCLFNLIKANNRIVYNYTTIATNNNSLNKTCVTNKLLLNRKNVQIENITSKLFSSKPNNEIDEEDHSKKSLPPLMSFPEVVWPSVLKTIKNWILINFIVKPYFDNDFTLPDFVAGTKFAFTLISNKLASGDLNTLNGLVSSETLEACKKSISKMSVSQRNELACSKDDIYFSFPYQVGIMFDENSEEKVQKRWVEITMVFHVMKGLKDMQQAGDSPPINMGMIPEYRDKISICNYRFIKEFTRGNESDWTINTINHFKPSDYIN